MMMLDLSRDTVVSYRLHVAHNMWERFRGLIGSKPLRDGDGFLIPYCQGIHTIGMSYSIDVVYLTKEGNVIMLYERLRPNRLAKVSFNAAEVLELPVGTIQRTGLTVGDRLMQIPRTP